LISHLAKGMPILVTPPVLFLPALGGPAPFLLPPFLAAPPVPFLPTRAIHVAIPSAAGPS